MFLMLIAHLSHVKRFCKIPVEYFSMRERDIVKEVRAAAQARGWRVIKMHGNLYTESGVSDLICVKDGRVAFLEVKTPRGRLTKWQRAFIEEMRDVYGTTAEVVRSAGDAVAVLDGID